MPPRPGKEPPGRRVGSQKPKTGLTPTKARPSLPGDGQSSYQAFCSKWANGCGAGECSRARKVVQARGHIPCDVAFIGEGPGMSEDVLGLPFVGPAGKVLDDIIERSVPSHIRWCIFNMVGCLPTDEEYNKNEPPSDEQVKSCAQRVFELTALARPRLIVCVGNTARDWLDYKYHHRVELPTMSEDGSNIPQISITHPAAILRMNVAVRGFQVQQAIVRISNAISSILEADGDE